jgi:hypothetical protein
MAVQAGAGQARFRACSCSGAAVSPHSFDFASGEEFERGGFWRRAGALVIDLVALMAALQLLATVLFPLTNGQVQFAGGFYGYSCHKLDSVPEGVSIPAEFKPDAITDCRQVLLGGTSARVLRVARNTQAGAITKTAFHTFLLDAYGKPIKVPPLDSLLLPLLFALRYLFDRVGGSVGRRICRVRLADAGCGNYPPANSPLNRRYAALLLPLAPYVLWSSFDSLLPGVHSLGPDARLVCSIILGIPALIALLAALQEIIRRKDTWYDRFAVTSVLLRVDEHRSTIPLAASNEASAGIDWAQPITAPEQAVAEALGVDFTPLPPLPSAAGRPRNYFARHWCGELSLAQSFWVNGLVGAFALACLLGVLNSVVHQYADAQPIVWMISLMATWLAAVLFAVWLCVGVWRSATDYQASSTKFWGGVAKVATTLGVLRLAYNCLFVAAPQIAGMYEMVSGDARVGPHQFRVLANGEMLEFSGGVTFGTAREFESFLNAMPNVRVVRLKSIGGRIREAQKMSDMVRARKLATFVMDDCLSACTIVFLGGEERGMLATARLGFHQPAFAGMTAEDRRAAIARERVRLQSFGLSKDFVERANAAPPTAMWYPEKEELLREHVVTRVMEVPAQKPGANAASSAPSVAPVAVIAPGITARVNNAPPRQVAAP